MHWDLGFALLTVAVVVWMYSSLRAEIGSIVEMLKRAIAAEETREHERITDVAIKNEQSDEDLDTKIRKGVYKDCPRYRIQDEYTIAELTRSYEREDRRGRIRFLRRVYRQGVLLPYELALKAVMDSDSSIREWMARESPDLNYSERQYHTAQAETAPTTPDSSGETPTSTDTVMHLYPERNLIERLKQDSDPLVRAALYENHHLSTEFGMSAFGDGGIGAFRECAPLERLAMMRNKELSLKLVKRILDPQDTTLCLENEEKTMLARACLVNAKVVQNGRLSREMFPAGADGPGNYTIREDSEEIWKLAASWPETSGIQYLAFEFVQAEDSVKASIFRKCQNDTLRRTILESCMPDDEKTIKLGRRDSDYMARYIAYGRSRNMNRQEIEDAIRRERNEKEEWVVDGLLENPWIGTIARELQKAVDDVRRQSPPADGASHNIDSITNSA